MSATKRPQRAFLTVTLMTVLAVTMVFMVYAALLATYTGTTVEVRETGGTMEYTTTNSTWYATLPSYITNGTTLCARIWLTRPTSQDVTIYWSIYKEVGTGNWVNQTTTAIVTVKTNVSTLVDVYATADGSSTNNYNWGFWYTKAAGSAGNWQVKALVYG